MPSDGPWQHRAQYAPTQEAAIDVGAEDAQTTAEVTPAELLITAFNRPFGARLWSSQMPWSYDLPDDLRRCLESALAARSVGPAEVWGEVVDWLNAHDVLPPQRPPESASEE